MEESNFSSIPAGYLNWNIDIHYWLCMLKKIFWLASWKQCEVWQLDWLDATLGNAVYNIVDKCQLLFHDSMPCSFRFIMSIYRSSNIQSFKGSIYQCTNLLKVKETLLIYEHCSDITLLAAVYKRCTNAKANQR